MILATDTITNIGCTVYLILKENPNSHIKKVSLLKKESTF